MKWAIYNILFLLAYPFMLPGFLVRMARRGGYRLRMGDRFGIYPKGLFPHKGSYVWIHAVSVGEVQVAGQLMRKWREVESDVKFCFSTTSSTGWKMAMKELSDDDVLIYNPLDFPSYVKSSFASISPRAVVLTESEIWPNFILQAKKLSIPLFLINARVSDRSAPRYLKARMFFGDIFKAFTRIFAQSDLDAERISSVMGFSSYAKAGNIDVVGSLKFDVACRNRAKEEELLRWIFSRGVKSSPVLLGGSTWPGEDVALLKIYQKILTSIFASNTVLVIAPRHFEKADEVEENIKKHGFNCVRRSRTSSRPSSDKANVYLADTTGELMGLYGISDVVFVGKSLTAHGSQNMIEPCLCGKPTVVGPYTENFRPVMSDLLSADAIKQVKDFDGLQDMIVKLLDIEILAHDENLAHLGERAVAAVERRRGATQKCVNTIRSLIA